MRDGARDELWSLVVAAILGIAIGAVTNICGGIIMFLFVLLCTKL